MYCKWSGICMLHIMDYKCSALLRMPIDVQSCQSGPVSACCTSLGQLLPYFSAVTPWTHLNMSGDIYSGASGFVCSFVPTILQEASWQTDGRSAAVFHKLLSLLHICVSPSRMFPSSGFDILQDELHSAVLRATVLVMLHLANSTNRYRCS